MGLDHIVSLGQQYSERSRDSRPRPISRQKSAAKVRLT
jgi:hypothetical protein